MQVVPAMWCGTRSGKVVCRALGRTGQPVRQGPVSGWFQGGIYWKEGGAGKGARAGGGDVDGDKVRPPDRAHRRHMFSTVDELPVQSTRGNEGGDGDGDCLITKQQQQLHNWVASVCILYIYTNHSMARA
jgi:hypothetical protein